MNARTSVLTLPSERPRNPELLEEMGLRPAERSSEPAPAVPALAPEEETRKTKRTKTSAVPGLEPELVAKKKRVSALFTKAEHHQIRMAAVAANLSIDAYIRAKVLASD